MIPAKISKTNDKKKFYVKVKKKYFYYLLILIIFILFFKTVISLKKRNKINQDYIIKNRKEKLNKINEGPINTINSEKINISYKKCYFSLDNSNMKIIHLIITRFIIEFYKIKEFSKKIYKEDYIQNGIRVMKKYLFPSLENQSCKNFIWILMLGNKANKTYIKSLLNFNNSFESEVIYQKDIKNYVRNLSKGFNVLITTRIDYDDRIYYDAVNDVRKAININRPLILYGYNRGVYYFESNGKYYDYYGNFKNQGTMSIFISLITVLNKVNDTYTIYDLGIHPHIRKNILKKYKSLGVKELNYEPAIFDNGGPKFVWVRQNYSGTYNLTRGIQKRLKINDFNLSKFYGK